MANHCPPRVLATDLDGTLIPLEDDANNQRDLTRLADRLSECQVKLVFVTGRHLESIREVMVERSLPTPDWIISDVGTAMYRVDGEGQLALSEQYAEHLSQIIQAFPIKQLRAEMSSLEGLRLQEEAKQGTCKLSYYVDAERLDSLSAAIINHLHERSAPYDLIASVDPFNGDGLIDLLPSGASKAYAVKWWAENQSFELDEIVFAGDSGNDLAALTAGYRSIVVGNADRRLADEVARFHQSNGWAGRLLLARNTATSGVLEGLEHFLNGH